MFGGKKPPAPPVGAKEKQRVAQILKESRTGEKIVSGRGGKKQTSPTVTIFIIYLLATGLAWFLSAKGAPWENGLGMHTGIGLFDNIIFSGREPNIMGDADMDHVIVVILRGIILFLASGLLPGMAFLWTRILDRPDMNPYRAVWGMGVGAGFTYFLLSDFLIPVLSELFGIAS